MDILNLFALLNDSSLQNAEAEDPENLDAIIASAKSADCIVYAAGIGKARNEQFQKRQKQVLTALQEYEEKLYCISNPAGTVRMRHPLSPAVRTWELSKMQISEVVHSIQLIQPKEQKKKRKHESKVKSLPV